MDLELYHLHACPYCRKVRDYIESHGLKPAVRYHEVSEEPSARDRVVALTGDTKVPVLVVDGKAVPGSNAILEWLATHMAEPPAGRRREAASDEPPRT